MLLLAGLLCVICVLSAGAAGEEAASALLSRADLQAMRVSQLRSFLRDRGEECRGCVEKV